MTSAKATPKAWAVLAYTIAEDTASSSPLDASAQRELEAIWWESEFSHTLDVTRADPPTRYQEGEAAESGSVDRAGRPEPAASFLARASVTSGTGIRSNPPEQA